MERSNNKICLRQGVGCKCEFCLPWLARWDNELVGFALFDTLIEEGRPLFVIYERLRAEHPDLLILHHEFFEKKYITHKITNTKTKKRLKIRDESDTETDDDGGSHFAVNPPAVGISSVKTTTRSPSSSSRDGFLS
jgi:hypothetical protein